MMEAINRLLNRMERAIRRFAIPNLMLYVTAGMLGVFVLDYIVPYTSVSSWLSLNMAKIAQGQVWRLVTFIFMPPSTSLLWIVFSLYFYYLIGQTLERQWGSARFNLFYLIGMLGAILSAVCTGYGANTYLNMSLFLAFAAIYPDFQLMVFFILPVKIKWLALADLLLLAWMFLTGTWSARLGIVFALLNVILFFGGDALRTLRQQASYWKTRRNFRKQTW